MGNLDFFAELSATNRAHCAAHGFSSAELYVTPPNEAEYETSLNVTLTSLNAMGPLKGLTWNPRQRPPVPHAVVEYARPVKSLWDQKRIAPAEYTSRDGYWTGD